MRIAQTAAFTLIAALAISAQDTKPTDHGAKPGPKKHVVATLTRQAAAMQKLAAAMEGTWKTTIHMEPSAWSPKASLSHGTMVARMGPGRLSLTQDFKSTGEMGPYAGFGLVWFDLQAGAYKSIWCDTMTPSGCGDGGTGNWDGDKIKVTLETEQDGKKSHMVSTWTFGDGTMTEEFQSSEAGGPMKRIMLIEYKRVSAPGSKKPTGKE